MEISKNHLKQSININDVNIIKFTKKLNEKKRRYPGIELIRILGQYAIIVQHIISFSKLISKYNHFPKVKLLNIMIFWNISSFGMISGIIGNKTHKYSNLFYLWYCALFYSISIHLIYKKYYPNKVKNYKLINFFFPVIFKQYWYFTIYFGLYLFLPLINKGLSIVNKLELKIIVSSTIGILIIWNDFILDKGDPFIFNSGYSIIGLLLFYIIGAYLEKYIIGKYKSRIFFIIYIFLYISSSYLCYYLSIYKGYFLGIIKLKKLFRCRISSLPNMLQSICIILIFTQIKYNKYLGKVISFFGPLTFGVYLSHSHIHIYTNYLSFLFQKYPKSLPLYSLIYLILLKGVFIFCICSVIDYVRYLIFKIIRIKEISFFIEKMIKYILY